MCFCSTQKTRRPLAFELVFSGMRAPKAYFADVSRYHPLQGLMQAPRLPMMVLQGGRDYQVTVEDFEGWKHGLKGRSDTSFQFHPELNHQFMGESLSRNQGCSHVAGEVIADIASWIRSQSTDPLSVRSAGNI